MAMATARSTTPIRSGIENNGATLPHPGTGGIDFVSRFFAPARGGKEDPVTGLEARQLSRRGGALSCAMREEAGDNRRPRNSLRGRHVAI